VDAEPLLGVAVAQGNWPEPVTGITCGGRVGFRRRGSRTEPARIQARWRKRELIRYPSA
jgi:hypothetical protein